jgi:hypothetical protein
MLQVHDGQCGLCAHFGESHLKAAELVQVRTKKSAPETMVDECGHPKHAQLHLKVTAISGCDGFKPAKPN